MQRKKLRFGAGFRVALGNRASQAAEMVIRPGKSEGGPGNRHRGADQWLYRTLNVYVPPAYDANGDELPRGRR
jgi:hypothetical protein